MEVEKTKNLLIEKDQEIQRLKKENSYLMNQNDSLKKKLNSNSNSNED